jgi:hypothetical protein
MQTKRAARPRSELTILIALKEPRRHPRVAARWLLRNFEERPEATIEEAAFVAACLGTRGSEHHEGARDRSGHGERGGEWRRLPAEGESQSRGFAASTSSMIESDSSRKAIRRSRSSKSRSALMPTRGTCQATRAAWPATVQLPFGPELGH